MTPADPNLLVIGGDTREQRVSIAGQVYVLRPMTLPQIEAFVRVGGAGVVGALTGAFAGESPDWGHLLVEHGPTLRLALHEATAVPSEVIDGMDAAQLIQFADVAMGLNVDFFVRRVRPALGTLVRTMLLIAQSASPGTSPTASRH